MRLARALDLLRLAELRQARARHDAQARARRLEEARADVSAADAVHDALVGLRNARLATDKPLTRRELMALRRQWAIVQQQIGEHALQRDIARDQEAQALRDTAAAEQRLRDMARKRETYARWLGRARAMQRARTMRQEEAMVEEMSGCRR